jgi:microcystin-dependent protein
MASTYSDRLKLELQGTGENAGTWGDKTNNNLDVVDAFVAGYLSKSVAGSSNVTLTTANASATSEASNKVLEFTGELTGNITVFVPAKENNYVIYNNTSGSFTLDIAPTGHGANSATITQGSHTLIYSTSTKCVDMLAANVGTSSTTYIGDGSNLTNIEPFPSGTSMLFQQTTAPTGWTKQTTHDNKALRLVSGSVSSGGSNTFSASFNSDVAVSGTSNNSTVTISGSTGSHTLTESEIPAHNHQILDTTIRDSSLSTENYSSHRAVSIILASATYRDLAESTGTKLIEDTGGDTGHSHTAGTLAGDNHSHTYSSNLNLDVEYVDFIIANKD